MLRGSSLTTTMRIQRILPANLDPEDLPLFRHELEREIPGAALYEILRPTVTQAGYLFDGLQIAAETFPGGRHAGLRHTLRAYCQLAAAVLPDPIDAAFWVTDLLSGEYFHWLTDCLTKLEAAHAAGLGGALVMPQRFYGRHYVEQSLLAYPTFTPHVVRHWSRATVRKLQVVTATAPMGNYNPDLIRAVGKRLCRHFGGASCEGRRIYISRAKATERRIVNEPEIVAVLQDFGFERVILEELPFRDQVVLLAGASHLISNHGAGLTNMIFMRPGGRVLEIRRRGDSHNNCYFSLASAMQHEYFYAFGDAQEEAKGAAADLAVDPRAFAQTLASFTR